MLDKAGSTKQINSDIKELQKVVSKLRLTATLLKGESKSNINQVIRQMEGQLNKIKLQAKFDKKNLKADVDKALQNISFKDINLNVNENKIKLKLQKVIADAKKTVQSNPLTLDVDLKKQKLNNQLTTYVSKNTRIKESESLLKQVDSLRNKIAGINDKDSLRNITQEFQVFKSECAATGYQTKSTTDKIRNMFGGFTKLGSVLGLTSMALSNFQKSLKTIRSNEITLTEISKTSDSTKQELEELGNSAFDTASKFGKISSDYLTAIQEMNRSGFYGESGKALGELTLLTQAAGDVSAETAQKYLLATNAAYGYAGNVEKLNAVLDGQNTITNRNSVDMQTMAEATEKAGSMAANTGVKIEELSAMIGTISARTKEAGTITGTGIKALLVNLQNISSDKITGTLEKANASMTETVNGVEKLRAPIAILKDLAKTYNSLNENDPLKSEITTNIGGKHHSNQLSALLSGWADYEKMLVDYSNGSGSAMIEAQKTAESLEGRLNALQNSWDELVNSIVNKNALKGGISFLDGVLQSAEKLIDTFDLIPVALASATAVMTAKNKDYGITQLFNEDGKFDVQGNFMGIDFDKIKHFREASGAIEKWNAYVKAGKTDINKFNLEVVKNNSQLREYLSTCSDGTASLKGYKASLQAAGVETNSLRLGTILLNTALSFGLGLAIQGVITGISKLSSASSDIAEKAKQIGEAYKTTQSEISDYKTKIQELHDTINSSSSSIEEVTNARQSLMSIQSEMIEKYGSEKEVIDMVTDAVNNQADAFDRLSEKKYQESVNEFNDAGFWENIVNGFSGYSDNMDRAVSEMENTVKLNMTTAANRNMKEYKKFEESIARYGKVGTGKFGDGNGVDHFVIELSGGLESIYEKLLKIQEEAKNYDFGSNDFNKVLTNKINETKDTLDKYSDIYDNYILHEKVLSKSGSQKGYDQSFETINNAMKAYKDAKLDGDEDKIRQAGENYARIMSEELGKISPDDENVKNYLQNLYPEMQEIVGTWNLQYDLEAKPESEKKLKEALKKFAGTNEIKEYDKDTSNDPEKNKAYVVLEDYANKYNLTLDQLIEKAQELGYVQDEKYRDLVKRFGQDNIDKLSQEEIQIAYTIKNTGTISFEELQKKISETKKKTEEASKLSFSVAWEGLKNPSEESLKDTREELLKLAEAGRLTEKTFHETKGADTFLDSINKTLPETIRLINKLVDDSSQLSSLRTGITTITSAYDEKKNAKDKRVGANTLDSMHQTLNISGWDEKSLKTWEKYKKVASDTKSTLSDFKKVQDELATSFLNNNNFLSNLNKQNQSYYDNMLSEMGITNAHAITTDILNKKLSGLALAKRAATEAGKNFNAMTLSEIVTQNAYRSASNDARIALLNLYLQQNILSNSTLNMSQKIQALKEFIKEVDEARYKIIDLQATQIFNNTMKSELAKTNGTNIGEASKTAQKATADFLTKQAKKSVKTKIPSARTSDGNQSDATVSSGSGGKGKGDKGTKTKPQKQEIDWIDRRLTSINNKLSLIKAKYENIASTVKGADLGKAVSKQNSNLSTQIKILEKLYKTSVRAESKYTKKASSIKIYKNKKQDAQIKNLVKSEAAIGKKTSYKTLIKKYGQSVADKITKYQDYYDKAQSAKQSAQDYKKQINDAEIQKHQNRADLAQSRIDKQEARKELAVYSKKNKYIDKEIEQTKILYSHQIQIAKLNGNNEEAAKLAAERDKQLLDYQVEKLQNLADEKEANYTLLETQASMTTDYKEKNKLSKQSVTQLKSQYKYLIDIAEKQNDITEAKRLELEKTQKLRELDKQRLEDITAYYSNKLITSDRKVQAWENGIAMNEAQGKATSSKFYNELAKVAKEQVKIREQEKNTAIAEYEDLMAQHKADGDLSEFMNSQEYFDIVQTMHDAFDASEQARIEAVKYEQQAIDANWAIAESAQEAIDALNNEADAYKNILGYKDMYDKNGMLTDEGTATIALDVYGIENNIAKIKRYKEEIAKLNAQYKSGKISQKKYDEQMQKLREETMDSVEAVYELRDALKSVIEDGLNAEMDAIQKMIDKVKQELSDASNLREYQKTIEKQTKNIASLERQIAAKSGDVSEAGRATLQKLKVQLEDARSELEDTEYDKYIEDQERILDEMSDELQDYIDAQLEQVDALLDQIIEAVKKGDVDITETLLQVGNKIGVDLSDVMIDSLKIFAETGESIAEAIYKLTVDRDNNGDNSNFKDAGNSPAIDTDGDGSIGSVKPPTTDSDSNTRNEDQRSKSIAWLSSKGFSPDDVRRLFVTLDNAQALFTGLQGAYSGMSAEQIFKEYEKEINKGHLVDGATALRYEETTPGMEAASAKQTRQQQNLNNVDKIAQLLSTKTKSYEHISSDVLSNISKYGSQKFMEKYNKGYFLTSNSSAKQVDDLVKKIVNVDTGEPLYKTSSVSDILNALISLNTKYSNALSNAATGKMWKLEDISAKLNVGGFSKGGIIDTATLSKIAEKNGDDGWVTVKDGEGIFDPEDTDAIMELAKNIRKNRFGIPDSISSTENMLNNAIPNQNINAGNNMYGDVTIHLDGSNVRDFKTFREELGNAVKNDKKTRDIISTVAIGKLTNDPNEYYRKC